MDFSKDLSDGQNSLYFHSWPVNKGYFHLFPIKEALLTQREPPFKLIYYAVAWAFLKRKVLYKNTQGKRRDKAVKSNKAMDKMLNIVGEGTGLKN